MALFCASKLTIIATYLILIREILIVNLNNITCHAVIEVYLRKIITWTDNIDKHKSYFRTMSGNV